MKAMENCKVESAAGGLTLAGVKILRGIFKRNSLLPLLFDITMMLLNYILKKSTGGNKFTLS